jgi:hypothetical protein
MERKPTLVVALGGNALLKRGEPLEAEIQRQNIELAARIIAGLTAQWRVVLVHGNGPQVGLLALQNSAYDKVTPYPLDILGAESQGMIGYMLQQALKNHLPQREVSVLLTQVEVAAADPAFANPTKYINLLANGQSQAGALEVALHAGAYLEEDACHHKHQQKKHLKVCGKLLFYMIGSGHADRHCLKRQQPARQQRIAFQRHGQRKNELCHQQPAGGKRTHRKHDRVDYQKGEKGEFVPVRRLA